jgi:hypothetical protein
MDEKEISKFISYLGSPKTMTCYGFRGVYTNKPPAFMLYPFQMAHLEYELGYLFFIHDVERFSINDLNLLEYIDIDHRSFSSKFVFNSAINLKSIQKSIENIY